MSTPKTPAAAKRLQSAKGASALEARPGAAHSTSAAFVGGGGLLDVFPVWSDQQVAEKEDKSAGQGWTQSGRSLHTSLSAPVQLEHAVSSMLTLAWVCW